MALVRYEGTGILPALTKLYDSSAEFFFANQSVRLGQDWNSFGVAAVVWDAAVVLCMFLDLGNVQLTGKTVIELGAGTGLVGIVATLLGATVTITDRASVLELLSTNVHENIPVSMQEAIQVRELAWGEGLENYKSGAYDLILGSDIVYLEETFPALFRTLEHLSSNQTVVLLSCRLRYARDKDFLELLRTGFIVEEIHFDNQMDIHIYKATRKTRPVSKD